MIWIPVWKLSCEDCIIYTSLIWNYIDNSSFASHLTSKAVTYLYRVNKSFLHLKWFKGKSPTSEPFPIKVTRIIELVDFTFIPDGSRFDYTFSRSTSSRRFGKCWKGWRWSPIVTCARLNSRTSPDWWTTWLSSTSGWTSSTTSQSHCRKNPQRQTTLLAWQVWPLTHFSYFLVKHHWPLVREIVVSCVRFNNSPSRTLERLF